VELNYPDGVRLVEIAPLTDPRLLAQTVASVLGVSERPGKLLIDTLITFLRPKHLLLLLDNCEHLIEACATLVDALLQKCPELTILTTSREPLDISGEVIWQVPPMTAPSESEQSAATLVGYEAARLFIDRAHATLSHFVLTDTNAPAIAQICRRLEGVPLALELAAARVHGLTVEEIAAHLEHRFALLTQGSRVAPARHQTLQGLIDWSYALLSAPEQLLFSRLAIFAGGFSAEAAQSVCGDVRMDSDAILDLLLRLVDKSLVIADDGSAGTRRYRFLETVGQYSAAQLAASGEAHAVALRHARYFLQRAEVADAGLRGSQSATWYAWLDREHENLRSALRWLIEAGNDEQALRLAAALGWFWYVRGHLSEAQASLETVRRLPVATPRTALRSRACFLSAAAAWFLGDYAVAFSLADEALAIGREVGAFQQIGQALTLQAGLKSDQGDYADARALLAEGLAACQAAEDDWSSALALYWLGVVSLEADDVAQARTLHEQALAIRRRIGDGWSVGSSVGRLAEIATQLGDYPATRAYADEALAIARQLGNQRGVARNLWYLGTAALGRGDDVAGQDLFQASLAIWLKIGERAFIPRGLEGIAAVAAARFDPATAVCLAGAAAGLREGLGTVPLPVERARVECWLESARDALGHQAAKTAFDRGRGMTPEAAVEFARSALSTDEHSDRCLAPGSVQSHDPRLLTAREREVVALIARGLSNRQIGDMLVISERTAEVHVAHIRDKLGLASRPRIAVWAVEQGLLPSNSD
jgi:predicted ATPase/DNA-binding CsgD family transcriptional regulator